MADSTFAFMAVIDAYKWWMNCDFRFLQATGVLDASGNRSNRAVGSFELPIMRSIARAYTVSRNIPAHDDDAAGQTLVRILCAPETAEWLLLPFAERADELAKFVAANKVTLVPDKNGHQPQRQLASALSKLTWFLRPEDWTIFDKYVGAAVLRRDKAGLEQMRNYYPALAETWRETAGALVECTERRGLPGLLGYRIADKYLFFQGIGMYAPANRKSGELTERLDPAADPGQRLRAPAVQTSLSALTATEQVLSRHMGHILRQLADDVAPVLADSHWIKEPA